MIVSVSRRCDIPAYAMDWFMSRLDAGFAMVRNPFDAGTVRRVSLLPEDVDCIAFWTRDPGSVLARAAELGKRGYRWFVQATITGYPRTLEPGVPGTAAAVSSLRRLADLVGPDRVSWRYDPVIVATGDGSDASPDLDRAFHLRNFKAIASALDGGCGRVTVSILDEYRGTRARLASAGYRDVVFGQPPEQAGPAVAILAELADIARGHGIEPGTCAEPGIAASAGMVPGACIDAALVSRITGTPAKTGRDRGQRPGCLCAPSVDIGAYGRCPAGCVYCYARRGSASPAGIDPSADRL